MFKKSKALFVKCGAMSKKENAIFLRFKTFKFIKNY